MNKLYAVMAAILLCMPIAFAQTLSYSVVLDYDSGKFSLKSAELSQTTPYAQETEHAYTARILSYSEESLYETTFNANADVFYSLPVGTATQKPQASKATIDLLLPYYPNAKTLQILKGDSLLLEVDLSQFSTCNENRVCETGETFNACPTDCTCGNRFCDANENHMTCSSDCPALEKDSYGQKGTSSTPYLLAGAIAVMAIAGAFMLLRRKKK